MQRCVAILGGSFDPVHNGHLALAAHFAQRLHPDELRIIPAGNPWQKGSLSTPARHRVEMVRRAFASQPLPFLLDLQEIGRAGPTYTIDTLRSLRAELGDDTSIVFLLGADQLQRLNTWRDWQQLFELAHLCAAARPGFALDAGALPPEVAREFSLRKGTLERIRETPHGMTRIDEDLAIDISATALRAALQRGERPASQLPKSVLDYIEQFHLYKE
ncbi:MAG: putative nicotinic acid mononucleotide adenylyltransferase, NAD(P)-requiring, NadD-like [Burkholderiaceae bacterium]|nr:putative nicotinic acid mononucleotide adenylyltransferase, NAD(P)-requiring, NadD-like [Burkholderiaceae bacterium]